MSTNESAKSRIIRLENRIKGIQCNSIGPFQTGPSSASDHPPLSKHYFYTSTSTSTSTSYSYVSNSIRRWLLWWLRHLFLLQGLLPAGVIPCNQRSSNHPYQSNIKAAHPAIQLAPNNSLTAPPVLPDPLIRYIKTKPHGSLIAPSKQGLSARQPFRCKSKLGIAIGITGIYQTCQTNRGAEAICLGRSCGQTCVNEERRGGPLLVSALAASPKQARSSD